MKYKIFLVEDDKHFAYVLKSFLTTKGYDVDWYENGEIALEKYKNNPFYHLMLIDIMMPKKDGITLVKEIRTINPSIPIIFITAKSQNEDVLTGYEVGADDYVIKPYAQIELMARLRALLRRPPQQHCNYIKWQGVTLDLNTKTLTYQNRRLKLKNKQYLIMECLLQRANSITTRQILVNRAWDLSYVNRSNLDCQISLLRKKIQQKLKIKLIQTEHGIGYSLKIQTNQGSSR